MQEGALNFKGLSQDGGRPHFSKNLHASLCKKYLSNDISLDSTFKIMLIFEPGFVSSFLIEKPPGSLITSSGLLTLFNTNLSRLVITMFCSMEPNCDVETIFFSPPSKREGGGWGGSNPVLHDL